MKVTGFSYLIVAYYYTTVGYCYYIGYYIASAIGEDDNTGYYIVIISVLVTLLLSTPN